MSTRRSLILALALLTLAFAPGARTATGQTAEDSTATAEDSTTVAPLGLSPAAQAFRQSVEDLLQQNNLLSGSSPKSLFLLIFDVNGARQEWAYGDRTDNGSRIPPDRFTVYSIGSVSKVFTATVVAEPSPCDIACSTSRVTPPSV
jgi:CubicO group peptidase (beta-lactamase class C family)